MEVREAFRAGTEDFRAAGTVAQMGTEDRTVGTVGVAIPDPTEAMEEADFLDLSDQEERRAFHHVDPATHQEEDAPVAEVVAVVEVAEEVAAARVDPHFRCKWTMRATKRSTRSLRE